MNLDNRIATKLIPFIAAFCDRTRTPIGKGMLFIIKGFFLGALFFLLIPVITSSTLPFKVLFIVILFMNMVMAISRGPKITPIPDVIYS